MCIVIKERKTTTIPYRSFLTSATTVALIFCTLFFGGTVLSTIGDNAIVSSRLWLVRVLSVAVFIGSLLIGAFATIVEESRQAVDIMDLGEQSYKRLGDKVEDKLPESST